MKKAIENKDLEGPSSTFGVSEQFRELRRRERLLVGIGLLCVIVVSVGDAIEDVLNEESRLALIVDLTYVGLMIALLAYIWRLSPLTSRRRSEHLARQAVLSHQDAIAWRTRSSRLAAGLSSMIQEQFSAWRLTAAESEVALLLLKGLSLAEISELRERSERTVRQQAASLYRKAKLRGRAELAAFFLEELLAPRADLLNHAAPESLPTEAPGRSGSSRHD